MTAGQFPHRRQAIRILEEVGKDDFADRRIGGTDQNFVDLTVLMD